MKTAFLSNAIFNHFFRGLSQPVSSASVGLLTAVSDFDNGVVTEAAYTGYARQPITFGAPMSSSDGGHFIANNATVTFPQNTGGSETEIATAIYASGTNNILAISFIDASAPFLATISASAYGGVVTTGSFIAAAHGLANGHALRVDGVPSGKLPTGLSENTTYFVISSSTDNFLVATTLGGVPVNITTEGVVQVLPITSVTINTNDTPQIASGALQLTDD
jgi:hypothetical protein